MERFARVTIGETEGWRREMLQETRFALQEVVYVEEDGGVSAPLRRCAVNLLDEELLFGDGRQLQFRVAWKSTDDEYTTLGDEEDKRYIECYKADVELIEYVNRSPVDVLIKDGEKCFLLLSSGGTVRVPFAPLRRPGPFCVPAAPGEDTWTEQPLAEHLGMRRAAAADVPWEGDLWTKAA